MRLFIAFEAPTEVSSYLKTLQMNAKKITLTKHFHCTLKFLDEVDSETAEQVRKRISELKFDPIKCTLTKLGRFPDTGKPKVIWVGLDPQEELQQLQQQVQVALKGLFQIDLRFHPHITLARVRPNAATRDVQAFLAQKIKPLDWTLNKLILCESISTNEGHTYRVLNK